jgi:hypothetical protein
MPLSCHVMGLQPLPPRTGGWSLTIGPVRLDEVPASAPVTQVAGFSGAVCVRLRYRSMAAEVGDEMARVLGRVTRGAVVFEGEPCEHFEDTPVVSVGAADLEQLLRRLVDDVARRDALEDPVRGELVDLD